MEVPQCFSSTISPPPTVRTFRRHRSSSKGTASSSRSRPSAFPRACPRRRLRGARQGAGQGAGQGAPAPPEPPSAAAAPGQLCCQGRRRGTERCPPPTPHARRGTEVDAAAPGSRSAGTEGLLDNWIFCLNNGGLLPLKLFPD